jgi:SAM-dependent methyltransferase
MTPATLEAGVKSEVRAREPCRCHSEELLPGALDFAAAGHLTATHLLHAFAARCPPPLARWAIETFTDPGGSVLDPMCGSGTTLVEAALGGRQGWGADIDPLARMISLAKATLVPAAAVETLAERVEHRAGRFADPGWRPELPRLDYWFRADVASDLAKLRRMVVALTDDGPLRRLAWTVFSSLIVGRTSVANARDLVHSRHHFRPWAEDPKSIDRFVAGLHRAAKFMGEYATLLPKSHYQSGMVGLDARRLDLANDSADLTFFSPPYVAALDYPRAHAFAVAWLADVLGTNTDAYREHARNYIGTDRAALTEATKTQPLPPRSECPPVDAAVRALASVPERAWVVARYFANMALVFAEVARVTRPGGHAVVVVCPSNIRKVRVPTNEIFEVSAQPWDLLRPGARAWCLVRPMPAQPAGTFAISTSYTVTGLSLWWLASRSSSGSPVLAYHVAGSSLTCRK